MKNQLVGICFLTFAVTSFAQAAKTEPQSQAMRATVPPAKSAANERSKPEPTAPVAAAPAARSPTGPNGFGSIKLGMTKEAVLSLSSDEPVRIVGELTPAIEKTAPPPGTEWFEGKITVPLAKEPVKATLTFKDGLLQGISFTTKGKDGLLESLAKQVAERYGPGKIEDDRKDEQCIYRNGNSFTLKSGTVSTSWTTPTDDGKIAETMYIELEFNSCPSNLRYGSMLGLKMRIFSIQAVDKQAVEPKKNLF